MPTYNYKCDECNSEFSVMQSIKDVPIDTCKKCGGKIKISRKKIEKNVNGSAQTPGCSF